MRKKMPVRRLSGLAVERTRINDGHRPVVDLNQLHSHLRNLPDISANHIHVRGKQHKRLAVRAVLQRINLCHGLRIRCIAPESPHGVCRIEYNSSIA